ncbi:MAG: NAD(P)/FAD-dependent oxidoreductase [Polyangiaceae bacterium]|nr:NAD(P)/FAD-dependent oxidoreductase [Polyangiaceae bacterium]
MSKDLPHVVIVGGGFGGLEAARALRNARVRITLVDKRNHHLFQPLLYQVATAGLAASDIAAPIRKILAEQENVTVLLDRAVAIDKKRKVLVLSNEELPYDFLILATGVTNDYFGNDSWEAHAPGLKSLEEALDIRRRVLLAFEAAEKEDDEAIRRRWLTFVVIGGGATGVEMAGALSEIARRTMAADFRNFNPRDARVVLLEGGPRLLPAFPPELSEQTRHDLQEIGVEVQLNARAQRIDEQGVLTANEMIEARNVLWAAGVRGVPLANSLGVPQDRAGRIWIRPDLTVEGAPGVFVIGDAAAFPVEGGILPGVAQVAIQQGRHAARNILAQLARKPLRPFSYQDRGSMATIGRNRAIAVSAGLQMTGFLAWIAWVFIHILYLVDFRNRLAVLFEWSWAYFSYNRSARIILERSAPRVELPPHPPEGARKEPA